MARVTTADGAELVLYRRGGIYTIRVDGRELMSSRAHGSERELARLACATVAARRAPRVLIGGLGIGFTLRAALDRLHEDAEVVVAEVFPEVVAWCRGPLAELGQAPLDDNRVRVEEHDVWAVLEADATGFDAILLDVDNGPRELTLISNRRLYEGRGLELLRARLRPGGVLGVWSADPDPDFERRLRQAGFEVSTHQVAACPDRDQPLHTIFVALAPQDCHDSPL